MSGPWAAIVTLTPIAIIIVMLPSAFDWLERRKTTH